MLSEETLDDLDLYICNNGHDLVYIERGTQCPLCELIEKVNKGVELLTDKVYPYLR